MRYYKHEVQDKALEEGENELRNGSPHIVLLNLDPESKKYNVIWGCNDRSDKWTVTIEEI